MKIISYFILVTYCSSLLSGCTTTGNSTGNGRVGPASSSNQTVPRQVKVEKPALKLDVVVPVMNPGIPEDYDEKNIWPELRRAEANRFSISLKTALENTGKFGAVRVTPDQTATGDLYVMGRINKSNGEDIEIAIEVMDISGRRWLKQKFSHRVKKRDFNTARKGKNYDVYTPVFQEIAKAIVKKLKRQNSKRLAQLPSIKEMRFGANFSEEAFSPYIKEKRGRFSLNGLPAEDDPMLVRTQAIWVRDQLFIDRLQDHYETFNLSMEESYLVWQKQSYAESVSEREARRSASTNGLLGILAVIGAVVIASKTNSTTGAYAAIGTGVLGASLISKSFRKSKEAKIHREALSELGSSLDIHMAPQIVAFEEKTVELTGSAKDQFTQWRDFLGQIYLTETVATELEPVL
ncbi:MAG: hypothetical protein COB49_10070 [Alphaproteobacteria bacterium]|nr:MAG: hypothetical protein COB49_10070 [Alphaproteobacteria bacterium]